jgi:hypothetical protein
VREPATTDRPPSRGQRRPLGPRTALPRDHAHPRPRYVICRCGDSVPTSTTARLLSLAERAERIAALQLTLRQPPRGWRSRAVRGATSPGIDPLPQCAGPDIEDGHASHRYLLDISFARAADQVELLWTLPSCSGPIDGIPAQAIPARASVAVTTLKRSRYSIRFVDTVAFDVVPDPSNPNEHWRGTPLRRHSRLCPPLHPPAQRRPRLRVVRKPGPNEVPAAMAEPCAEWVALLNPSN